MQQTFHWENVWDRLNFFFEDVSIAERVSRRLLCTAETEGRPVKLTSIFSTLSESAPRGPRGEGEGEARD